MTTPTASARKTAISEMRWNRKLINRASSSAAPYRVQSPCAESPGNGVPEVLESHAQCVEHRVDRPRHDRDHEDGRERGRDEQDEIETPDAALVQLVHALRADEDRSEPQPREEGGCHPLAALVEELDHRRVGSNGHDELRAGFPREQHRDVLTRAFGHELLVVHVPLDELLATG